MKTKNIRGIEVTTSWTSSTNKTLIKSYFAKNFNISFNTNKYTLNEMVDILKSKNLTKIEI